MNKYIQAAVAKQFGLEDEVIPADICSKVLELNVSDAESNIMYAHPVNWDFSDFPNIKKIDCSYNLIKELNVTQNPQLEYLRWEGVRGKLPSIDLSHNPNLKTIKGGQDGLKELDLSGNSEIENIDIFLNQHMRWINLDNCQKLKSIKLAGVLVPFVDLTQCRNLELVDIHYMNTYARKYDEYGSGRPGPLIFVSEDFNERIIPLDTRNDRDYVLLKVSPGSKEEAALKSLKSRRQEMLNVRADMRCEGIAYKHYELLEEFDL